MPKYFRLVIVLRSHPVLSGVTSRERGMLPSFGQLFRRSEVHHDLGQHHFIDLIVFLDLRKNIREYAKSLRRIFYSARDPGKRNNL